MIVFNYNKILRMFTFLVSDLRLRLTRRFLLPLRTLLLLVVSVLVPMVSILKWLLNSVFQFTTVQEVVVVPLLN
eukprot:jgi/Orpsp1_1/1189164/evm.model.d7180000069938.1